MSVTTSQNQVKALLAILNLAGWEHVMAHPMKVSMNILWIIPEGKKNRQEVMTQLQAVPAIRSISVVALSKQVKQTELPKCEHYLLALGWDATVLPMMIIALY